MVCVSRETLYLQAFHACFCFCGSGLSAPHTFDTWNIFTFATELQRGLSMSSSSDQKLFALEEFLPRSLAVTGANVEGGLPEGVGAGAALRLPDLTGCMGPRCKEPARPCGPTQKQKLLAAGCAPLPSRYVAGLLARRLCNR